VLWCVLQFLSPYIFSDASLSGIASTSQTEAVPVSFIDWNSITYSMSVYV
jgi:hypothetical protein